MAYPIWWTCDLAVEVPYSLTKYGGSNEPDLVKALTDSVQESVNEWVDSEPAVDSVKRFSLDNGWALVLKRQNESDVSYSSYGCSYDDPEYYFWFELELERGAGLNRKVPLPSFFLCHPHSLACLDKWRRT